MDKVNKNMSGNKDRSSSLSSLLQLLFHHEHHSYHQNKHLISKVKIVMLSQMNLLLKILLRHQLYHVNDKLKIVKVRINGSFKELLMKNIERCQVFLAAIVEYRNVI